MEYEVLYKRETLCKNYNSPGANSLSVNSFKKFHSSNHFDTLSPLYRRFRILKDSFFVRKKLKLFFFYKKTL